MSITSASPPMSLTALLQPGDDISYRQPSSQTLSYGRIVNRVGETLTVRRYDSVELDVDDLPELFIILQELVQTDEQENIPTNIIEGIIFVLTVKQISTNIYNVEGIVNCFFLRYRRVRNDEDQQYESLEDSFSTLSPSSIPCLILHSIRSIQNELKKINVFHHINYVIIVVCHKKVINVCTAIFESVQCRVILENPLRVNLFIFVRI